MARRSFTGDSRRGAIALVALVTAVTGNLLPKAAAISDGYIVPSTARQVNFTAAILKSANLDADGGTVPTSTDPSGVPLSAGDLLCGGTVVDKYWVLTANHCVRSGLTVRLDSTDSTTGGTLHRVVTSESYPSPKGELVDVALLKIDPPANEAGIDLAPPAAVAVGKPVSLLGWGMTAPGSGTSAALQEVDMQIVPPNQCSEVTASELCVANPKNPLASACYGDSGGPAVAHRGNRYVLAGVTSRAGGTAPTCQGATVYVNVPYVSSWVKSVISSGG